MLVCLGFVVFSVCLSRVDYCAEIALKFETVIKLLEIKDDTYFPLAWVEFDNQSMINHYQIENVNKNPLLITL